MIMKKIPFALMACFSLAASAPALAQDTRAPGARAASTAERPAPRMSTERHSAAQAAGYLALHLCSATFSSGLSEDMIRRTAGRGRAALENATNIHREEKWVSVAYADDMEPRLAAWRPGLGCTQLPIGAGVDMIAHLPSLPSGVSVPNFDDQAWPMGDVNATASLPKKTEQALNVIFDEAFKDQRGKYLGNTWGVVVVKDGKIVGERYAKGWNQHTSSRTNSMCKSIGSSIVGVGIEKGLVDLHARAPLKAWQHPADPRGNITLNHLLHMASGLYTQAGRNPQGEIYGSGAPASEVSLLNIVDAKPGERFVYAGSDTILATRAVREAVDNDKAWTAFPQQELLWKIGMTRTQVETDWTGDFITSGQCWSTPRDFARFGLLYLADGVWNGERILPEGWSNYVATLAPAQPGSRATGGAGYGGQFWIYGGLEGLPEVAYSPGGALGQYAMIIPEENLVVVRRGLDRGEGFEMAKFSADVMRALR